MTDSLPPSAPVGVTVAGEPEADGRQRFRRQRFSLRGRVIWLTALCVAVAVALVSLGAYLTVRNSLYTQVANDLLSRAVNEARQPPRGLTVDTDQFLFTDIRWDIINSNGDSQLSTMPDQYQLPSNLVSGFEKSVAGTPGSRNSRESGGYEVVAVNYPFVPNSALVVAEPLTQQQAELGRLALVLALISAGGVLVAVLAGTIVARGGLRPVQRLTSATERVARTGDLRPIPVTGDDELGRLTLSFNHMLAALAESRQRQRQLVADAGHELRTPLTSLRTNLELLVASEKPGAPTLSEADRNDILADVHAQLDELTTLIGALVELARDDDAGVTPERVELIDVIERALERVRRRRADVRFDVALQPWSMLGDSTGLERAVLNLLDNAVKFSPHGGLVRLVLRQLGDGTAVIEVADSGPGIADADLPKVFDRFYRSSEARALPGSGLGLAIVRQTAQRHGGEVYASRAPTGGALLTMRLPGQPGGGTDPNASHPTVGASEESTVSAPR